MCFNVSQAIALLQPCNLTTLWNMEIINSKLQTVQHFYQEMYIDNDIKHKITNIQILPVKRNIKATMHSEIVEWASLEPG